MHSSNRHSVALSVAALALAAAASLTLAPACHAATGRSFMGPHEYALPGNVPDGFDVFLVYGYLESADRFYDGSGHESDSDRTDTLVSLLKYSHGFTLESNPNLGFAWEVILPVSSARNKTANSTASGVGDPIVAPYVWYKLSDAVTIGTDFLFHVPLGNSEVGGGDSWKLTNSVFMDVQLGKFNYTGDVIWNYPGESTRHDARAGKSWSTEHIFSYRTSQLIEPYLGAAYEYQKGSSINVPNSETDVLLGMMFHLRKMSAAVHWVHAVDGKSRPVSDSVNVRFVWPL